MNRNALRHVLTILGINAVPALGWFVGDWSSGTTLAVYWFENVAVTLFIAARVSLHRRWAPCNGHFRYRPRKGAEKGNPGSLLSYFLPTSLIFSAAHGFFLGMLVLVGTLNGQGELFGIEWSSFRSGCTITLGLLTFDFLLDLSRLRTWPFLLIEGEVDRALARVIIVHLTIVIGLFGIAALGINTALFAVFLVLKTLNDLATFLPQWNPAEPPAWLCRLMDRVPSRVHPEMSFAEFWKKDRADEISRKAQNELPTAR